LTQLNLLEGQQDQLPQIDPEKKYLEELVGDDKKFKDLESLARGKFEADQYIENQNRKLDELKSDFFRLKADYDARAKLEEYLEKLPGIRQDQQHQQNHQMQDDKPAYNPDEVKSLISNTLIEHETRKQQEQNFASVQSKLTEKFGSNYQASLQRQMDEIGLSADQLNQMARTNPKLLIEALNLDAAPVQEGFQAPPRSQQRSDNFAPSTNKRTWTYYEKMKKENPHTYWTPKIQDQLHKDHMALGQAFEDGSYHQ
jgi:hypothetical protein